MLLPFNSNRILQDPDAPFLTQVGTLSQYFIFKIGSLAVACHHHDNNLNLFRKKAVFQNIRSSPSFLRQSLGLTYSVPWTHIPLFCSIASF